MRVRTEARRQAIVDAARVVFMEQGFDRASMSEISKKVGGSKATLYSYFPSKEDLFVAAIELDIAGEVDAVTAELQKIPDIREKLERMGREYLARVTSARPISVLRIVANMPVESRIGLRFYERGLRQAWMRISIMLSEQMQAGVLRRANGWIAAMHLKGLLEGEFVERRLLNAMPPLDQATIDRVVHDAVDVFMRAYGPES